MIVAEKISWLVVGLIWVFIGWQYHLFPVKLNRKLTRPDIANVKTQMSLIKRSFPQNDSDIPQTAISIAEFEALLHRDNTSQYNFSGNISPAHKSLRTRGHQGGLHLMIIMGRGIHLRKWKRIILESPDFLHIDLVLGVFDESVDSLGCSGQEDRVTGVSVTNTTWTIGRNKLVQSAFRRERAQNISYSFWTLIDAGINLHCPRLTSRNLGDCFKQYDALLSSLPVEVTATAIMGSGHSPVTDNAIMINLQAVHGAWNSFRREVIHVLFPYRPDLDSNTWWSSQAIFWNKIQCLAPLFVVAPLYIFYTNPEYNQYPRNPRDFAAENVVREKMMRGLSGVLPRAPIDYPLEFKQERVRTLPLETSTPLSQAFHLCSKEFSEEFYSFVLRV